MNTIPSGYLAYCQEDCCSSRYSRNVLLPPKRARSSSEACRPTGCSYPRWEAERLGSEKEVDTPTPSASTAEQQEAASSIPSKGVGARYIFNILVVILPIALLVLLLPIDRWLLLARPAEAAVTTIYRRLYRQGHHWGIEADASRTPHEFAADFASRLEQLAKNEGLAPTITTLLTDLNWLTELYTHLLFSPHPLAPADHQRAVRTWTRLHRRLLWLRLIIPNQIKK
jgi:hypothetical protein